MDDFEQDTSVEDIESMAKQLAGVEQENEEAQSEQEAESSEEN